MAPSRPAVDPVGVAVRPQCVLVESDLTALRALESRVSGAGFEVVGLTGSRLEALLLLDRRPSTVFVVPFDGGDLSGPDFARRAAELVRAKVRIVFSLARPDPAVAAAALDAGAHGVVLGDDLLGALAEVAAGRVYVDPRLV